MKWNPSAISAALLAVIPFASLHAAEFLGPRWYYSFDGPAPLSGYSPFANKKFDYFYLEDFEDAKLNTPGVKLSELKAINVGGTFPPGEIDVITRPPYIGFGGSVDKDDGLIDNISSDKSSNLFSNYRTSSFTFKFFKDKLGHLPTHVGIVWTDVGKNDGEEAEPEDLVGEVIFEAFDANGKSLGRKGPFIAGDESEEGTTVEDRFVGVIHEAGIYAVRISMPGRNNWSVDHLQYGYIENKSIKLGGDLAFGSREVGSKTKRFMTISANGNSALKVKELRLPPGFRGKWSGTILPGKFKEIPIYFMPESGGTLKGDVSVICDAEKGAKKVPVSGKGVRKGVPSVLLP